MAKKLFEIVMETLEKNGMAVEKETAKAIRSHFNMTQENVSEKAATFCGYAGGYAAEAELDDVFVASHLVEALKATKTHDETVAYLKEIAANEKAAVDPRLVALAQAESEPANADDQNFVETELAAEDEANGADAVGESIGSGETCAVMDSTMPVGPLAQNPLADVAKPAERTVVSTVIKEGTEKLEPVGTTLIQFLEKYPDKLNITGFPVGLAQTAELRHRKDKAQSEDPKCEYWKLKMLSREEIIEMLYDESHEFDWLRDVALGKIPAKKTATMTTSSDKFEKEYFVLHMFVGEDGIKHYERVAEMPSLEIMKKIRTIPAKDRKEDYYNLRLWIDKSSKNPAGFVYTGDDAKHPFMKFYWGFQSNGLSFPTPMVQKRDQQGNYNVLSTELKDIKHALKKALEDKGYKPTYYATGAVKPGITMQRWGFGVMNS